MKAWIFSDSHNKHRFLKVPSDVDIAIFAGDAGTVRETSMNANIVLDFFEWYKSLTHIKYKLFTPGNHDTSIQAGLIKRSDIDKSITFLLHESVTIEGIKIFMSPYTPSFGTGWAYNIPRGKLDMYWKDIPTDTDILVTHGPPKSILDLTVNQDGLLEQCGCKSLLNRINTIENIQYSIFGHLHEEKDCYNSAMLKVNGIKTTFINACVVNLQYEVVNNGFIIEI